ncbi:MAG: DNA-directed RNA polymerase subunit omega [Planctomycetota bacterium]
MIKQLRDEDIINKVGGRFRFTALIQKRWRELMLGARPMVEPEGKTQLEIVIQEISEGKIEYREAGKENEDADES